MFVLAACDFERSPIREYNVTIFVTENDSDIALNDADVSLKGPSNYQETTDGNGVASFSNVRTGSYDVTVSKEGWFAEQEIYVNQNKSVYIEAERRLFFGYDGQSDDFGDIKYEYLDFISNKELNNDLLEYYWITIEKPGYEYTLRHKEDILEFYFERDYDWIGIEVINEEDISDAVDGLDDGYINDITDFRVTDVFILDKNYKVIKIPDGGIEIIKWDPETSSISTQSTRTDRRR